MKKFRKVFWGIGAPALILALVLGGWIWILASREPLHNLWARILPWPVVCTTRGCVTTKAWAIQVALSAQYTSRVQEAVPSALESLTTAVRRHLLTHAFVVKPVTVADARRYREEILHLKDEAQIQDVTGVSSEQYDQQVILPFLQQAALQQQRNAESVDELYAGLAQERWVLVLPFHLRWDKDSGSVVQR